MKRLLIILISTLILTLGCATTQPGKENFVIESIKFQDPGELALEILDLWLFWDYYGFD